MSGLSFLKNVTVKPNSAVKTPTARTASAEAKNPTNADIRIMKNGATYPSAALVTSCNLQYTLKVAEDKGNGFDVFSSKDFLNTQHLEDSFLFIALVPKNAGKVDLFGSTKYDENDVPTGDVLTQGSVTGGLAILELIKSAYGIEIQEGKSYIDLRIVEDQPFTTPDNIYFIPKKVSRGDNKGQVDLVRRENLTLYALVPVQLLEEGGTEENVDPNQAAQQDNGNSAIETPNTVNSNEPTLSEIEADNEGGEISPAAALPNGTLEDQEIDAEAAGFELEDAEIEDVSEVDFDAENPEAEEFPLD